MQTSGHPLGEFSFDAVPVVTLDDHQLAAQLATEAGELLLELRSRLTGEDAPPAMLKAEAIDKHTELLMQRLAEHRPDDAV